MKLRRYVKNSDKKQAFGNYYRSIGYDFRWYVGNGKIGLDSKKTLDANAFAGGFLITDDMLFIDTAYNSHIIYRSGVNYSNLNNEPLQFKMILESMLLEKNDIHVFTSAPTLKEHYIDLLTFSTKRPNRLLYEEVEPMRVFHKYDENYYKNNEIKSKVNNQ